MGADSPESHCREGGGVNKRRNRGLSLLDQTLLCCQIRFLEAYHASFVSVIFLHGFVCSTEYVCVWGGGDTPSHPTAVGLHCLLRIVKL